MLTYFTQHIKATAGHRWLTSTAVELPHTTELHLTFEESGFTMPNWLLNICKAPQTRILTVGYKGYRLDLAVWTFILGSSAYIADYSS